MKIAYLLEGQEEIRQPPFNGPAVHVRQVIQELLHRGHQVRLLARLDGQIWKSDDLIHFDGLSAVALDGGWQRLAEKAIRKTQTILKMPYWGYFESLRFAQACQRELVGCDVFLERFAWMNYGGLLAARRMNIPWVTEYNGNPLADLTAKKADPQRLQRAISIRLTRWVLNQADHVIATGDGWQTSCIEDWGAKPEKISVIENGTELLQQLDRNRLQAFRDLDPSRPVQIVYLGGFYPWHGIEILLRALCKVWEGGLQIRLMLIGAGDGMRGAQDLVKDLGLARIVEFTGNLSAAEYAPYLANADIGVSPYCGWQEYSGLKLFDYKAAGLACIASGENGQPKTLHHGKTGWIVPPCDVDELSRAILRIANDHSLRRTLGRSARIEAEAEHGWDRTTDKIEELLVKIKAKRGNR